MKRTSFAILIGLFCLFPALFSQVRSEFLLEKNWKFTREDSPEFINPTFNDSKWQSVTVPHDWAIYGPFSSQNDKQEVAIAQDGQTEAMEHAGRTGGLPFVGVGWYRTEFEVPQFTDGKRATILFDGAMSHAKVYVNGQEVGYWPYGYNSFYFDITKQLMPGKKNTLAVRLENLPESSRYVQCIHGLQCYTADLTAGQQALEEPLQECSLLLFHFRNLSSSFSLPLAS